MINNKRYYKVRKSFKKSNLTIKFIINFILNNNSSSLSFRNFFSSSFWFQWHFYYSSCKVVKIFQFSSLGSNCEKKQSVC
jgi:hypothetical protein